MSNYVYSPSEININFGVPVTIPGILEADFSIEDFISVAIVFSKPKFSLKMGIFREKTINYDASEVVGINITLSHGSSDNEPLNNLFKAQELGVVGLPLSVRTIKSSVGIIGAGIGATTSGNVKRRSYVAPVAILTKQPSEGYTGKGGPMVYEFITPYIQTIYL